MLTPEQLQALDKKYTSSAGSPFSTGKPETKLVDPEAVRARLSQITADHRTAENLTPKESASPNIIGGIASFGKGIGELGKGFAGQIMSLPQKAAELGSEIGTRAAAAIRPDATYEQLKEAQQKGEGAAGEILKGTQAGIETTKEQLAPKTPLEKAGAVAENIAEFFTPVGAEKKAAMLGKAASLTEKAPLIVKKGVDLLSRAGLEGVEQAARTALQSGGDIEETKTAAEYGAAFPVVTSALKGLGSLGKNVLKTLASKFSGVPTAAIEHAFENPESTRKAIRAMAADAEHGAQSVVQSAEDSLNTIKNIRRESYREGLKKAQDEIMQSKAGQWYVKRPVTKSDVAKEMAPASTLGKEMWVATDFSSKGVKDTVTKTLKDFGAVGKAGEYDLSKVALPNAQKRELQEVAEKIYSWDDVSPLGLDDLRENIAVYRKGGIAQSSADKKFNAIIDSILDNTRGYVNERVPQIAKMNNEYAAHSRTVENIMNELTLGKNKPTTAARKLTNVFNPRSEAYRPIVSELGEKGGNDLMSDIAGLTMSRWTPEGFGAHFATGAGAIGALTKPSLIPQILTGATLSSPRIIGETVTAAGQAAPYVKKAAEAMTPAVRGIISQEAQK